ncbi:hypothetical protein KTO58_15860 [Chitinophaga pendula]|uniref:UbiA family prenyltransferase n=1 Tax=Chitinophaga TaxID=79328 RepID=UPI0012FD55AC|nr:MULTISPECIES: UbiA family prenyltransferase [Chitinophaga]UCJ05170.1 hypothetical protein KTO58_15860 [Chitinophaga pendula]
MRAIYHFLLFTSIFIATCALMMIWQTNRILGLRYDVATFYTFVFFATLCSYNFHWYLTTGPSEAPRMIWGRKYRRLQLILFFAGLIGAAYYFWLLRAHWLPLSGAIILTFLYSAPKVPQKVFMWLRKVAIGKTLFLTAVWTYVTTLLPVFIAGNPIPPQVVYLNLHRFFLIYAICILFDLRDIESDRKEGIRSLITYLSKANLDKVYYASLLIAVIAAAALWSYTTSVAVITLWLAVLVTALLTRRAQQRPTDYLFYFVLDGMMMFSALLHYLLMLLSGLSGL